MCRARFVNHNDAKLFAKSRRLVKDLARPGRCRSHNDFASNQSGPIVAFVIDDYQSQANAAHLCRYRFAFCCRPFEYREAPAAVSRCTTKPLVFFRDFVNRFVANLDDFAASSWPATIVDDFNQVGR